MSGSIAKTSPIKVPKYIDPKIQLKKNGYYHMQYKWIGEDGYQYICRWHTRTPNAPLNRGDSWVVERRVPGVGYGPEHRTSTREIFVDGVKTVDAADDVVDAVKAADDVFDYSKFPQKIHEGRQGKHIIGSNEYQPEKGRSIVTISGERIIELVKKYTGTGRYHNSYRETVDFGEIIGKYIDPETGIAYETTKVTIHYSQKGFHIVPAKPENWRKKK